MKKIKIFLTSILLCLIISISAMADGDTPITNFQGGDTPITNLTDANDSSNSVLTYLANLFNL